MSFSRFCVLAILFVALVGCGSESRPVSVTPPDSTVVLKKGLEGIAASGEMGSEVDEIEAQIEKLKATDPQKATALSADFQQLKAAKTKAAVQSKAKEMAGKL